MPGAGKLGFSLGRLLHPGESAGAGAEEPRAESPRLLIAETHLIVCQGLAALLVREGFTVVAQVGDAAEAAARAREVGPDVAVLDLGAQDLEAAGAISEASAGTRTILLTALADVPRVVEALRLGVKGYVLKSQGIAGLAHAVREAARGAAYFSPEVASALVNGSMSGAGRACVLTPRQREVLQLVADGKTTRQIAGALGVSVKTAESHRLRLMGRLAVHETAGLVRCAIRLGLVQP